MPTAPAPSSSASPGWPRAREVIRTARELNPSILILARTAYIRELVALKPPAPNEVYSGEGEVALAFTEDRSSAAASGRRPSRSTANAPGCTEEILAQAVGEPARARI